MILLFFLETISRMAKTIIDAVMGLSFDDSPCNLASAALLYALTSDVSCSLQSVIFIFVILNNVQIACLEQGA